MRKFIEDVIEGAGEWTGEAVGGGVLKLLRERIKDFNIETTGESYLEALKDKQYLLVANHLMPESGKAQQSQLSPDAFVLEELVRRLAGQELRIVSKCDDGWWSQNDLWRGLQKHVINPFGHGMSEGMGFIPVFKNPGSFNKDFVKIIEKVVAQGKYPILIFPEGHWYEDFDPKNEMETGAASIAKKHRLPLLPAYIHGARNWEAGAKVNVSFSQSFEPGDLTKEQITEEIRSRLTKLQQDFQNKEE